MKYFYIAYLCNVISALHRSTSRKYSTTSVQTFRKQACILRSQTTIQDKETFVPDNKIRLHDACEVGDFDAVTRLLNDGADFNEVNSQDDTPVCLACQYGHLKIVNTLLDRGASIESSNPYYSLLHHACMGQHADVAMELIRRGVDLEEGLHYCRSNTLVDVSKELVRRGVDLYKVDDEDDSALSIFFRTGPAEVALEMLNRGIDVNQGDERGRLPLILAAESKNASLVDELLRRGADVNIAYESGHSALHAACTEGMLEVVKILLKAGANPNSSPEYAPLLRAYHNNHVDIAMELIQNGADVNVNFCGLSPLHHACKEHLVEHVRELIKRGADTNMDLREGTPLHVTTSLEIVKLLLDNGARVNNAFECGYSPLYSACGRDNLGIVKEMLDHGADLKVGRMITGDTPLHAACAHGHLDIVKELLDRGADPDVFDVHHMKPIHDASSNGHIYVVFEFLRRYSMNFEESDYWRIVDETCSNNQGRLLKRLITKGFVNDILKKYGGGLLHEAVTEGHIGIVKILLDHGVDINERGEKGMTALYLTCSHPNFKIYKELLKRGADINLPHNDNMPLDMAAIGGSLNIMSDLLDRGANINRVNSKNITALHNACYYGKLKSVKMLLDRGANVNPRTISGKTPLYEACFRAHGPRYLSDCPDGYVPIVEELLRRGADANIADHEGKKPIDIAEKPEIKQLLMSRKIITEEIKGVQNGDGFR